MERSSLKEDLVLNSSVIIKWFCEEENTDIALGIREGFIEGTKTITTPDLSMYEIANALRYNKNITKEEVEEAVNSLIDLGIDILGFTFVTADESLFEKIKKFEFVVLLEKYES